MKKSTEEYNIPIKIGIVSCSFLHSVLATTPQLKKVHKWQCPFPCEFEVVFVGTCFQKGSAASIVVSGGYGYLSRFSSEKESSVWLSRSSLPNKSSFPSKTDHHVQEDEVSFPSKTFLVPNRTFPAFHARQPLCTKQDIHCAPNRTLLVFQARRCMCSTQDVSFVPNKTFFV